MATLLPATTIGAASAGNVTTKLQFRKGIPRNVCIEVIFAYGAGGTSVDAWIQTSIDGGATWIDIANANFTTAAASKVYNLSSLTPVTTVYTPTDGTLTANTAKDGVLGNVMRVKWTSVGTYTGLTNLAVHVQSADLHS